MTLIKSSDREVAPGIFMSLSSIYNKAYRPEQAQKVIKLIQAAYPIIKRELGLTKSVKFRIGPIKAKGVRGRYTNHDRSIAVDQRFDLQSILETIAHELVHAKQYESGDLSWNGTASCWKGRAYSHANTYAAYRALPWEAEAFALQSVLALKVIGEIGTNIIGTKVVRI